MRHRTLRIRQTIGMQRFRWGNIFTDVLNFELIDQIGPHGMFVHQLFVDVVHRIHLCRQKGFEPFDNIGTALQILDDVGQRVDVLATIFAHPFKQLTTTLALLLLSG